MIFSLKGTKCKKIGKEGTGKEKGGKRGNLLLICWFQFTKQNLFFEKISYFFPQYKCHVFQASLLLCTYMI